MVSVVALAATIARNELAFLLVIVVVAVIVNIDVIFMIAVVVAIRL